MIRRKYSRIIAMFVAAAVVVSSNTAFADSLSDTEDTAGTASDSAAGTSSSSSQASSEEYENDMLTNNYTHVSEKYTVPGRRGSH